MGEGERFVSLAETQTVCVSAKAGPGKGPGIPGKGNSREFPGIPGNSRPLFSFPFPEIGKTAAAGTTHAVAHYY